MALKEKIKLCVALPSYQLGTVASFPLLCLMHSERIEKDYQHHHFEQSNSLLAMNDNMLWTKALNLARKGELTHFLMIHADVRPRANQVSNWFDLFLNEMERTKADVLSAAIPIKNTAGFTSTALDTNRWSPQRLTQHQINRELPVTWTADTLLVNTGLMLVDLRGAWKSDPPFFTINDEIWQDEEGDWQPRCEPEDWNFSRMCHKRGMRVFVTRIVPVDHFGTAMWSSDGIWGHEQDPECEYVSLPIRVTDADGKVTRFVPSREALANSPGVARPVDTISDEATHRRLSLPIGYFETPDIAFYRDIYSQLVPENGQTVEVGVYRGRSIVAVSDIVQERHIHVTGVDTFDAYRDDSSPTIFEDFQANVTKAGLGDHVTPCKMTSIQAAAEIPYGSLDFVFLDADHTYESVREDIKAWLPRIKPGGWIGGHDYKLEPGVTKAIDEAFKDISGRPDSSIWLARR